MKNFIKNHDQFNTINKMVARHFYSVGSWINSLDENIILINENFQRRKKSISILLLLCATLFVTSVTYSFKLINTKLPKQNKTSFNENLIQDINKGNSCFYPDKQFSILTPNCSLS